MESETFKEDFMMKLIWRLSGNLIYHIFSINPQTNHKISPYCGENTIFPVQTQWITVKLFKSNDSYGAIPNV